MRRELWVALALTALGIGGAAGQAVPDDAQARRIESGYRRWPSFGVDPFRHVMVPRWGFVVSTGASAANNALNLEDLGALKFLGDNDELTVGDAVDVVSLVPPGQGLQGALQGEGSVYFGVSLGRTLTLGVSAAARGYGTFDVDDEAVTLLRDGNLDRQEFSLGQSDGVSVSTADVGLHGVVRLGPLGSRDGVHVAAGFGLRHVRPAVLFRMSSLIAGGGTFRVTGDSIAANLAVEVASTVPLDDGSGFWDDLVERVKGNVGGSGSLVGDLLLRAEWPSAGIAFEGMVLNVGAGMTVAQVPRRADTLLIQTTSLDSLREALGALDFDVRDSVSVDIALPRIWRLSASAWANRFLQLDLGAGGGFAGDIQMPLQVDLGATLRLIRHVPLRGGVILGGRQDVGYVGGLAIESRNFLFQLSGQSAGGLFGKATGVGGRIDFGFFF